MNDDSECWIAAVALRCCDGRFRGVYLRWWCDTTTWLDHVGRCLNPCASVPCPFRKRMRGPESPAPNINMDESHGARRGVIDM